MQEKGESGDDILFSSTIIYINGILACAGGVSHNSGACEVYKLLHTINRRKIMIIS